MPVNLLQALGGTGQGNLPGLVPEPIEGDSLTRYLRSLMNLTGAQATQTTQQGQGLVGAGLTTLQQPTDYWSSILSGGPEMWARAAPEARTIMGQYTNAANAAQQFAPRGGGRAAVMGELPFRATSDISNLLAKVRPEAAVQLQGIAQLLASMGLSQEQIGSELMRLTLQGELERRGQNIQERGQLMNLLSSAVGLGTNVGGYGIARGLGIIKPPSSGASYGG